MSQRRTSSQIRAWLKTDPPLGDLRAAYPDQWQVVERELMAIVDTGDLAALDAYARSLAQPVAARSGAKRSVSGLDPATAAAVRQRMAAHAIRTLATRAATGVQQGSIRLSDQEGAVMQELLFSEGLQRKPVDLERFQAVWPTLQERARLMPLVQPKGIYCCFSDRFVALLAERIGARSCLEIAAGDGTLSWFLSNAGVAIRATDDHSWDAVTFTDGVERLEARAALKRYAPQVVVCSWPPAANTFEAAVFEAPSVETYIVVGNRHTPGWGDHGAYAAAQPQFTAAVDEQLSAAVLPPELEPTVYVFTRAIT